MQDELDVPTGQFEVARCKLANKGQRHSQYVLKGLVQKCFAGGVVCMPCLSDEGLQNTPRDATDCHCGGCRVCQ